MKRVLVLGTGIIGLAVSKILVSNNHIVYGVTQSIDKAVYLKSLKINPIVCNVKDINTWKDYIYELDVIIECIFDHNDKDTSLVIYKFLEHMVSSKPEIVIIYTSGVWTYNPVDMGDENSPNNNIVPIVLPKIQLQEMYQNIGAIVIQPPIIFGSKSARTSNDMIQQILSGKVIMYGNKEGYQPFTHINDLCNLYLLVVEYPKKEVIKGHRFIAVSYNHKKEHLIDTLKNATNKPMISIEYLDPINSYQQLKGMSQSFSNLKACTILKWKPVEPSLIENPSKYIQEYSLSNL